MFLLSLCFYYLYDFIIFMFLFFGRLFGWIKILLRIKYKKKLDVFKLKLETSSKFNRNNKICKNGELMKPSSFIWCSGSGRVWQDRIRTTEPDGLMKNTTSFLSLKERKRFNVLYSWFLFLCFRGYYWAGLLQSGSGWRRNHSLSGNWIYSTQGRVWERIGQPDKKWQRGTNRFLQPGGLSGRRS